MKRTPAGKFRVQADAGRKKSGTTHGDFHGQKPRRRNNPACAKGL
jgi:hypothetical protein